MWRSLAVELYAVVYTFDYPSTPRPILTEISGQIITMTLYTDIKRLYGGVVGMCATTMRRLLIDLKTLRESFELRELLLIFWITFQHNPADAMTKESPSLPVKSMPLSNCLDVMKNFLAESQSDVLPLLVESPCRETRRSNSFSSVRLITYCTCLMATLFCSVVLSTYFNALACWGEGTSSSVASICSVPLGTLAEFSSVSNKKID